MVERVALYADRARAGKSTCARYLNEFGYVTISFATPVKAMVHLFLEFQDIKVPEDKEAIIPELGVSLRHLYQTLGTEWGRDKVGSNCWTNIARHRIQQLLDEGHKVVVDDLRFESEYAMLKDLGFVFYRVINEQVPPIKNNHRSEQDWSKFVPDCTIFNHSSKAELYSNLLLKVLQA